MRRRRGSAALETALVIPMLVLLLAMAVDQAFLALIQHQLGHAARVASRYGITGQAEPLADGHARIAMCDAGSGGASPRLDRIRALVAANLGSVLRADRLCLNLASYAGYQAVGRPEPLADINGNGRHDAGEAFTDINGNGRWDADQGAATPGGADAVTVYALRYVTTAPTGLTPGLGTGHQLTFEARVVVRNEPF